MQKKEVFDVYIVRRVYRLYVVGGPLSLVKNTQVSSLMVRVCTHSIFFLYNTILGTT